MKTNEAKTWRIEEIGPDDKNIRFIGGNRQVDAKIVAKLKGSMVEHGVLSAITVMAKKKNYHIVDGQHRYTAAKELGYSIPAIVITEGDVEAIKDMNTIQKSWSLANFADFYAEMSVDEEVGQSYHILKETQETTALTYSALLHIHGNSISKFKKGLFLIKDKDFVDKVVGYIQDIKPFVPFADLARFIDAYVRIVKHESYEHGRMMDKLNLEHRIAIDKKANPAGYGRLMQDIYNYHSTQKNLVMFANW